MYCTMFLLMCKSALPHCMHRNLKNANAFLESNIGSSTTSFCRCYLDYMCTAFFKLVAWCLLCNEGVVVGSLCYKGFSSIGAVVITPKSYVIVYGNFFRQFKTLLKHIRIIVIGIFIYKSMFD